uniref:Fibronectin type-III domain-containing protein n=1 Tax=Nothobranchius furzeri TaxID=105023 RepID=A0A8C6L9U7_NOTFU
MLIQDCKFKSTPLEEGIEYEYRVYGENIVGIGKCSKVSEVYVARDPCDPPGRPEAVIVTRHSGVVIPMDKIDPPEMILNSELRKGIVVRAGGSMRICIPFKGRPIPEINWAKEDAELPSKVLIEKGEDYTQLSIDICDKFDAGKYILKLENSAGSKSAFVSVKVLDTPGAPLNLQVKDIKRESVTLTWEPPVIDGGSRIKNYLVEKRESTRNVYSNVDSKCTKTSYRITGLTEGTIYYFRVLAENEFGVGQAVETEESVKTSEPPLPVGKVNLTEVTKTTVSLSWEKPVHDGGSRIIGYYIEMQPAGSEEWVVAATTKTCEGIVLGLKGHSYEFRVSAENAAGVGKPSSPTQVLDSPSAPVNLQVKDVKRNSVSLSWEPPLIDGGTKISHYIVEKREQKRMAFTSVCTNCVRNSFIISDLQEGGRYSFRVLAVNELGVGLPATTDQVKVSEAPLPPGKIVVVDVTRHTVTGMLVVWGRPASD